ncbi:MAG TPA: FRG domain-containing protein [Gemmatimonadaceae bacterium]|nr:FRG domain-containing protein [Gemmatimonadaceae bacterium]
MATVTATSWADLQEALFADTYNERIGRFKARYAFRGVSDASYEMKTSLMRLGGSYTKVEAPLLRQFRKYAHEHKVLENSDWYWLSVAQHYGLPTRLLDWSYSPQVALHFATCNTNNYDRDGAVIRVNYKKVHELLPRLIRAHIEDENTWILTVDLLERAIAKGLHELDAFGREKGDFAIFFEPPSLDARMVNQYAYFSLLSRPDLSMSEWLQSRPELWDKVIIPKTLKWEVRDKLDQSNINERILFPGLAGLSEWLRRYYLPTGSAAT